MSWQIPTQIELDIIAGKATYRTFQTGNGGQSILPVPPNSYAVIFGYDFSPAGGGLTRSSTIDAGIISNIPTPQFIREFETQQIGFFTGSDFFPFIHHVNINQQIGPSASPDILTIIYDVNNTPIARQVYITSTNDVAITVGLINTARRNTATAIPITNRTPQALTYGGSPQLLNTQTDYGPLVTPQNFMQPSTKDYADFAFGLLPNNPDDQAFATPDFVQGLIDPSNFIATNYGGAVTDAAAAAYYLCIHYALYSKTIPEQRG
jgi:hypothetical protein